MWMCDLYCSLCVFAALLQVCLQTSLISGGLLKKTSLLPAFCLCKLQNSDSILWQWLENKLQNPDLVASHCIQILVFNIVGLMVSSISDHVLLHVYYQHNNYLQLFRSAWEKKPSDYIECQMISCCLLTITHHNLHGIND